MGEFERIDWFLRAFREAGGRTHGGAVTLGPGDDAALVESGRPLAVTTDAVFEHVHFRRDWATAEQIGHKALAVNLSDLAAMGARATAFTCAFGLPAEVDDEFLAGLARGMARLAGRTGAVLAGGNFSKARELSITITAMGEVPGRALRRDAARPGDAVMLVGETGTAAAELAALLAGRPLPEGRSALHEPWPQLEAGLRAAELLACGIDVSDGLAQDLGHVARASGVRIHLDFEAIPRSDRLRALTAGSAPRTVAQHLLAGGEDYALALCGPREAAQALGAAVIGRVEAGRGVVLDGLPEGTRLEGWNHFA